MTSTLFVSLCIPARGVNSKFWQLWLPQVSLGVVAMPCPPCLGFSGWIDTSCDFYYLTYTFLTKDFCMVLARPQSKWCQKCPPAIPFLLFRASPPRLIDRGAPVPTSLFLPPLLRFLLLLHCDRSARKVHLLTQDVFKPFLLYSFPAYTKYYDFLLTLCHFTPKVLFPLIGTNVS